MYKRNYFNFKERENNYLITNDWGKYSFVDKEDFEKLAKKENFNTEKMNELRNKGFIYEEDDEFFATKYAMKTRKYKTHLLNPTNLHIFVVTKNCNFNCIYCQAGYLNQENNFLMDKSTAKAAVDIALQSPTEYLTFEFQGGEPLINFETIKYIIEYSKEIGQDKEIEYNVVTNLTLLTDDMIDFFAKNNVALCTSLDGNEKLHNINRPYKNGNSYIETTNKMKQLKGKNINIGAIETTTKFSLDLYKEIIDEYVKLGLNNIFLRPLTKLGKADNNWGKVGYTAEEFLEFYKNALDYIIDLNKKGIFLSEGHCTIFLNKILNNNAVNYMELRSPCGGAIGQLAYYYDGKIYTCDEGRMLSDMGDDSFLLGDVFENTYKELMESDCTKAMCISSCLECSTYCNSCVYMPYCGTCPVINLAQNNSIFNKNPKEYRCKIYGGIIDIIFDYIENDYEAVEIFKKWIN